MASKAAVGVAGLALRGGGTCRHRRHQLAVGCCSSAVDKLCLAIRAVCRCSPDDPRVRSELPSGNQPRPSGTPHAEGGAALGRRCPQPCSLPAADLHSLPTPLPSRCTAQMNVFGQGATHLQILSGWTARAPTPCPSTCPTLVSVCLVLLVLAKWQSCYDVGNAEVPMEGAMQPQTVQHDPIAPCRGGCGVRPSQQHGGGHGRRCRRCALPQREWSIETCWLTVFMPSHALPCLATPSHASHVLLTVQCHDSTTLLGSPNLAEGQGGGASTTAALGAGHALGCVSMPRHGVVEVPWVHACQHPAGLACNKNNCPPHGAIMPISLAITARPAVPRTVVCAAAIHVSACVGCNFMPLLAQPFSMPSLR